jgi:hypothetical protein
MQLDKIKQQYEEAFVEDFSRVLGEKFEVICNWGVPVIILEITSKDPNMRITWKFSIDTVKPDYILQTSAVKIEDDKETPTLASIDRTTLEFIVNRAIFLAKNLFKEESEETVQESSEEEVN